MCATRYRTAGGRRAWMRGTRPDSAGAPRLRCAAAVRIDHVILAAADLDAAVARLEAEHGLVAAGGGRHQGLGTENRIVPLGGGYLELVGIADAREAQTAPFGRGVARRLATAGDGLMGWAVAGPDVAAGGRPLGAGGAACSPPGVRARPAGGCGARGGRV